MCSIYLDEYLSVKMCTWISGSVFISTETDFKKMLNVNYKSSKLYIFAWFDCVVRVQTYAYLYCPTLLLMLVMNILNIYILYYSINERSSRSSSFLFKKILISWLKKSIYLKIGFELNL